VREETCFETERQVKPTVCSGNLKNEAKRGEKDDDNRKKRKKEYARKKEGDF